MLSQILPGILKNEMADWISTNPILAGLLAIIGLAIHARITKIVRCIFDFIQDLFLLTDKLETPDETYISFLYYLHENPDNNTISMTEESLQIQTQETCWWEQRQKRKEIKNKGKTNTRKLVKIPGSGFHMISIGNDFWSSMWIIVFINESRFHENSSIIITTFSWNRSKWNNFLQFLLKERSDKDDKIKIYLPERTKKNLYSFRFQRSIPTRELCHPSLPILPNGIKEDILKDAKRFLNSKKYYNLMGLHWSRGYAFLGEPGNGKSSISKWLACELKMNLCIIKQKIYEAGSFASLMEHCPENSIIVIEDFDTLFDIEKREDSDNESSDDEKIKKKSRKKNVILKDGSTITLGEILNAIESPLRKQKTIITFSSNMEKDIDPALLRPGRIDKIVRLPNATYEQVVKLFKFHYPLESIIDAKKFALIATNTIKKPSMAEIRGCLMYQNVKESFNAIQKFN